MENKKRKDGEETSERRKQQRTENRNGVGNPYSDLRVQIQKLRSGAIERVRLRNFMCHTNLEVNFNRCINFIVGRNGSGKSAILTAIVVGLGGKASVTSRAASIKDFVKKGCASAFVEITLSNDGYSAYKHDLYGDKIIVTRNITASGQGAYKVKGVSGEVLGTKREDLDMVVSGLNIQVDNPISVLNQDCARTFLSDSNAGAKYNLFLKSTRMDQVMEWYKEVKDEEHMCEARWQSKMKAMQKTVSEIQELKRRLDVLQSLNNTRQLIAKMEDELIWAHVRCEVSKLGKLKEELDKENAEIPEKETLISKYRAREETLQTSLGEITTQMKELQEEVRRLSSEYEKAVSEHQVKDHKCSTKMAELREHKKRVRETTADIETLEEVLRKSEREGPDKEQQRKMLLEKCQRIGEEIEQVTAAESTTSVHLTHQKSTIQQYEREFRSIKSALLEVNRKVDEINKRIRQLRSETHGLSVFGSDMPQLIQAINDADKRGVFKRKPVGPLGAYLKVKDAQWTGTVENFLGIPLLFSFCCDNPKDGEALKKIIAKVIVKQSLRPNIYFSKFLDKVHDVSSNVVHHPQYQSLYNILDISSPVIANWLIDKLAMEHVLLVPTNQAAYSLLSDRRKVPRNCKRGVTLEGDTYYPDPDFRTYAGPGIRRPRVLQVSSEEAIRNLEEEREGHTAEVKDIEQQIAQLQRQLVEERKLEKETEKRLQSLGQRKRSLTLKKSELEDSMPRVATNREVLGSELADAQRKLEISTQEVQRLEAELKELLEVAKISKKQVSVLNACIREKKEKLQKLQSEAGTTEDKMNSAKNKLRDLEKSISAQQSKLKHNQKLVKDQEEKVKQVTERAMKFCSEIATDRHPQDIKEEISRLKETVNSVESQSGNLDEVAGLYESKRQEYDITFEKMNELRRTLQLIEMAVVTRKRHCQMVMKSISMRIKTTFHRILSHRKYQGSLEILHEQRRLNVRAQPINGKQNTERDAKTLSGGERSFATMALIMALWEAVNPPFFIMDEFDVFMDKVNRGCVIELLLTQARNHDWLQYLFLTPQDTSSVRAAQDLKIIEMGA